MQRLIKKSRSLTIRKGIKLIFILQAVTAGLLLVTDIGARWDFETASKEPDIAEPVSPGDQVRRYDPTRPKPNVSPPESLPDLEFSSDLPPRLNFTLRQDPDIGTVLFMHGQIASGDALRVKSYFENLDALPDGLALHSSGGIVNDALEIGRLVRSLSLNTMVMPGTICLSSCPYILAGGVERQVSLSGAVGLHQHYYETPGYLPAFFAVEAIQLGQGETMRHLIEMGVDPGVMLHGLMTPPDDIYLLVENQLLESRLATETTE